MPKIKIPFFFNKAPIDFINDFEKTKLGVFRKPKSSIDAIDEVEFSNSRNEFKIEFDFNKYRSRNKNLGVGDVIKKVKFDFEKETIILNSVYINKFSNESLEGSINQLHSEKFSKSKKQYFKFVIPNSKSLNIHNQIENTVFKNDYRMHSSLATKINLVDDEIFILEEKDENKNKYLIIESRRKQTYKEFSNKTFAIRIALGYVTGYFAGNKGYFFSYSNAKLENYNDYYFTSLRDEIKTLMNPINTNPFSWLNDNKKVAEKYYKLKIFRPILRSREQIVQLN